LVFCFFSVVNTETYYVEFSTFFPSKSGAYITFDSSLLPLTFNNLYRDSQTRWYFNDTWVSSTLDMTINAFYSNGWFNYSVSGIGTQQIHNGSKPSNVYFDGVESGEGDKWSYSGGTVTVVTTGTNVSLLWGGSPPSYGEYSVSGSSTSLVYGENFSLQFYEGQSLGFQSGRKTVVLDMTTGNLTSNSSSVYVYDGGGLFGFEANESLTMKITYDVTAVKVWGDQGKEHRVVSSGSSINIDANDIVNISWDITIPPLLPLLFILGMGGLFAMGGGSIYAVQKIKKKEYFEGFKAGTILISIGFAFFLAWLW